MVQATIVITTWTRARTIAAVLSTDATMELSGGEWFCHMGVSIDAIEKRLQSGGRGEQKMQARHGRTAEGIDRRLKK